MHNRTREDVLADKLGELVKGIQIDKDMADWIAEALQKDSEKEKGYNDKKFQVLTSQATKIQNRMKQAYRDKLDGNITEEFFQENMKEWQKELSEIQLTLSQCDNPGTKLEDGIFILELSKKAYLLYSQRNSLEKRKILNFLLSNGLLKSGNPCPVYRKPFDILTNPALCSVRGG